MSNKISKIEYYKITLEKALNLLVDSERCAKIFAENVLNLLKRYKEIEDWDESPIADYMDAYLNAKVLKDFMNNKIKNPDDKMIEYTRKHKINGVLMTKHELSMLQTLITNFEETKEYLNKKYGFSTILN